MRRSPAFLAALLLALLTLALSALGCSSRTCDSPARCAPAVYGARTDPPAALLTAPEAVRPAPRAAAPDACPGGRCGVPSPFAAVLEPAVGREDASAARPAEPLAVGKLAALAVPGGVVSPRAETGELIGSPNGPPLAPGKARGQPIRKPASWLPWAALALALLVLLALARVGRRGAPGLAVLLLAAAALPGCATGLDGLGVSMPASERYVDDLHAAQDQALAKLRQDTVEADTRLRADLTAADAQLRTDFTAADLAGKQAFDAAVAQGKTIPEAVVSQISARASAAERLAAEAKDLAERKSADAITTATDLMKSAKQSAAEAIAQAKRDASEEIEQARSDASEEIEQARSDGKKHAEESSGGRVWYELGGLALALLMSYLGLRKYDRADFVGPNGEKLPESALVAAASSILKAAAPKPPAA